jgi:hypothetical protein
MNLGFKNIFLFLFFVSHFGIRCEEKFTTKNHF